MTTSVQELEGQIEARRQRLSEVVQQLREVLRADIPTWFTRQARAAFLDQPEASGALSAAQVSTLKRGAAEVGPRLAAEVDAALAEAFTSDIAVPPANDPKSLEEAPAWRELARVGEALGDLLASVGLGAGLQPDYKAPAYFVSGHYFPTLAEHYWGLATELADLERRRRELTVVTLREALVQRWNDA